MMADSDTQSLIENGEVELLGGQPLEQRQQHPRRPGLRTGAVLAALGCAAGAAVLLARRGGANGGDWDDGATLREGMTQLALVAPAACSAYTDCAALPGNCCPTDAGNALGCCNSPRLDTAAAALGAAPAELGPAPEPVPGACEDTWGWTNGYSQCNSKGYNAAHGCMPTGLSCRAYALFGWCADGAVAPGKAWTQGEALNFPETNCCACGKAPNPPADDAGAPAAPVAPALAPVPAPPAALPGGVTQAPTTDHAPTLGPPQVPAAAGAASAPPPPTSAPLAGGAAPNGTQGEPVGADCALNSGCASLGMAGACCPTADGVMLGCCSTLESSGPPVLPAAKGPGPLMTFYMYRVANDEDYPLNGVNMANLAGDMWYLHNEVVQHCPRKFNMERLLRFKVTARATAELHGQRGRNFDAFVAFDQAKCTVPMCEERHWAPFGYVVGCQPNNVGQVAVPGSPTWYSLPGTCPNKFYYEKTAECSAAEPGGACPTSDVTGTKNCTYYLERAGEIRLDDLSGLQDYNKVCRSSGVLEFDQETDLGVGTKFWNGKTDAAAGSRRMQTVKAMFAQKYPTMPADLEDPTCDVPQ